MNHSPHAQSTVYVGGFSQDTTATTLHSAFIPFGDILDISLPSDPAHKGSHRGFAFITFASPEAALDACDNMHRNCLQTATNRGKVLKVNKAKPPKGAGTQGSNKPSTFANSLWHTGRARGERLTRLPAPSLRFPGRPFRSPLVFWSTLPQSGRRKSGSPNTEHTASAMLPRTPPK